MYGAGESDLAYATISGGVDCKYGLRRLNVNSSREQIMKKCDICGGPILPDPITGWDLGHNAEPVREGRCCDSCNSGIVLPARLAQLFGKKEVDNHPVQSV